MVMQFLRRDPQQDGAPRPSETKASAAGPVLAWHGAGRVAWRPRAAGALFCLLFRLLFRLLQPRPSRI